MYLGCIRAKELAEKSGEAIPDLREYFSLRAICLTWYYYDESVVQPLHYCHYRLVN